MSDVPIPSKQKCLLSLAQSGDRSWDDLLAAWNSLYDFLEPNLRDRGFNLQDRIPSKKLRNWRAKRRFPWKQVSVLNLSTAEVDAMIKSICYHIKKMNLEQDQYETVQQLPAKRPRDDDKVDDDVKILPNPKAVRKRAKPEPKRARLPATTKIYFMEENNTDSRTGIMVTLLSNDKPENNHLDIKTLRYGNATRHLAKRSTFDKNKHLLFYYDLENPKVRITVDSCASFRAAVDEMFAYRRSEPRIQFCFHPKDGLARNNPIAPMTPVSNPRTQPQGSHRFRSFNPNRKIDFRGRDEQYKQ